MDSDDMLFDPAPAANARAGGKFKPRARPRPKKEAPVSTASAVSDAATERPVTQSSSGTGEVAAANPKDAFSSVVVAGDTSTKNQSRGEVSTSGLNSDPSPDLQASTQSSARPGWTKVSVDNPSTSVPGALDEEFVTESPHFNYGESMGSETADGSAGGAPMEATAPCACTEDKLAKRVDDDVETPSCPGYSELQQSVTNRDATASENDADTHLRNGRVQTEEAQTCIDMEDLDIVYEASTDYVGQHTGKFKPKPKLKDKLPTREEKQGVDEGPAIVSGNTAHSDDFEICVELNSTSQKGKPSTAWEPEEPAEFPSQNATVNEDDDLEYNVEGNSWTEGVAEKSMEDALAGKEKPVRKRRKTREGTEQSSKEPPKRFSRSTRRKKRTLPKELLETPDEEIRFLPIKDMLQLIDYKERLEKKEAKESGIPSTNQSTEKISPDYDSQSEEPAFGSESTENQESIKVQSESFILNYHSYMRREPRSKWTKQDTELFYEAVRQFGSDLSMIQQLFPDRSRHQIKLKYKKEERQQPLKLHEALANRTKDHSHFEKVIKRLQEEAARAAREASEEEEGDGTGEEAEMTNVPNPEEVTKSEPAVKAAAKDDEIDVAEAGDEPKSDGSEDEGDEDVWSTYKSEF